MSKKVKGQKLDLATFVGPSNPTLNLPTAPDPQRQRKDVRKFDDKDRMRDNQGWSRNVRNDDLGVMRNENENESVWRKSFGTKANGDERSERPKLNLLPKSNGPVPNIATTSTESVDVQEDKWSKVFKNVSDGKSKGFSVREDEQRKFGHGNQKRNSRDEVLSFALPTAPRSVAATQVVVPTPVKTVAVKDTSFNDQKAAKALLKQEADRKAKELKEQRHAENVNAAQAAREASERAYQMGLRALSSGLKGDALLKFILDNSVETSGSMLVRGILEQLESELTPWWTNVEYGSALHHFLEPNAKDQVSTLFVVQDFCFSKKFPKVDVKGVSRKLIEYYFAQLLSSGLVDGESFIAWADDSSEQFDSFKGRLDAIVQTTNFVQSVRQALLATEDDAEDEEIDAPRETVK